MTLVAFEPSETAHHPNIAELWNEAAGADLAMTTRLVAYNTLPTVGIAQTGCWALADSGKVGFVLASVDTTEAANRSGWIDALAVHPAAQRQGHGSALLNWAEHWLRSQGATELHLGGSLYPFVPGLPVELQTQPFFEQHGFQREDNVWDVARRLRDYGDEPQRYPHAVRPVAVDEVPALLAFFDQAFPNRWRWECQQFLGRGGRSTDFLAAWHDSEIVGFCHITLPDSVRPLDPYYLHGLPQPWGQLGAIGVSDTVRGAGYGGALLDRGLRYLQAAGVDGCVIDWTTLLDFYGKFGFRPYREYAMLTKRLCP